CTVSLDMLPSEAFSTAMRSRGLLATSAPPIRAATVISLISRVNSAPRLASWRPLRCWMLAHFEWPAIDDPSDLRYPGSAGDFIIAPTAHSCSRIRRRPEWRLPGDPHDSSTCAVDARKERGKG